MCSSRPPASLSSLESLPRAEERSDRAEALSGDGGILSWFCTKTNKKYSFINISNVRHYQLFDQLLPLPLHALPELADLCVVGGGRGLVEGAGGLAGSGRGLLGVAAPRVGKNSKWMVLAQK